MNSTLRLAEKLLAVLSESNETLECQRAAGEIVVSLFKAEPYGSLAWLKSGAESIADASQFRCKGDTFPYDSSRPHVQHLDSEDISGLAEQP